VSPWQAVALVPAGIAAGLTGSIAGLASLISYPALLAVGLPPVTANVTNTVSLVFNSIGSVSASRPELSRHKREVAWFAVVGVFGGLAGGLLLLATSADTFRRIVPWLIGLAAVAILLPRRPRPSPVADTRRTWRGRPGPAVLAGVFAISIYGGYFGAAAGVLMLALFLNVTTRSVPHANALKNAVLGSANLVAAVTFTILASVAWSAVVPLACGLFIGGRIGPVVVRRAPDRPLRLAIATAGLVLAMVLAVKAY
jgi:hypothetical protein